MELLKKQKISFKITFLYSLIFSGVLLVLSALVLFMVRFYIHSNTKSIITAAENEIEMNINNTNSLVEIEKKYDLNILITDAKGNISYSASNKLDKINTEGKLDTFVYMDKNDNHYIYINKYLSDSATYLQVSKSMDTEYYYLKVLFFVLCIIDSLGVGISILAGFWFSKNLLGRINKITEAAQNITINNLNQRIPTSDTKDELANLADTFNDMIERLQIALDRKLQFVADASHELRTPITIIQGYSNLIQRWGKDDKEALEQSINGIKLEADAMAKLVENLLLLAKSDSGIIKASKKEVLLSVLVTETVKENAILSEKYTFISSENTAGNAYVDYNMIKQMLRIFVDNSMRYSNEDTIIDISSYSSNNVNYITVEDKGTGIPQDDILYVFDRFYRVEKSRSKEMGGTGLGLSIATLLAQMNNIELSIESVEGEGTKIIMKF